MPPEPKVIAMTKFTLVVPTLLSALVSAVPAGAQSDQGQSIGFGGDAPPMCAVTSAPTSNQAANVRLDSADLSQGRIVIDQLVDTSTAELQPASIKLSFDVTCNAPHRVLIKSVNGALEPVNPPATLTERFVTEVYYSALLTWDDRTIEMVASGNAATARSQSLTSFAITGQVNLEIKVDPSLNDMGTPLLEGTYSDMLVITLGPQI